MKNIQEKITEVTNFKSQYVKSLRMNYLYYKTKAYKKIQSKKDIEKTIYNKLKNTYSLNENYYNIKIINDIITNQKSHLVAEFKDFLIKDDISEFIYKFYSSKESKKLLITIFNYYNQTSVVFPNYILLTENKYLYKMKHKEELPPEENLNLWSQINDKNDDLPFSSWQQSLFKIVILVKLIYLRNMG